MSATQEDLYAVLGVNPTATPEEIKAAYFKRVRRHPPDKDPAGFRRLQAAYDVLRQEKTRKEYDDTQRTDPEARAFFDAGRRLLQDGKAAEALQLIKQALARQPGSPVVRDLLVQALVAEKQYEEAEKHALRVLALEPENPTYSVRIGDILRTRDHDAEALPYYRKAVFLDRTNSQNVVRLATLLNYLDQPEEAIKLLEQSIHRDGKVDFDDFVYFKCLYTIFTLRQRYDDLEATRRRIREILPPDAEQRSFVAWFYYETAMQMAKLGNFEAAVRSIEEAGAIDGSLPDLAATVARLRNSRETLDQIRRLREDASFEVGLRMTCWTVGFERLLGEDDDLEKLFDQAADLLNNEMATEGCNIGSQVRTLESRYPALAGFLSELLTKIRELDAKTPKIYVRLVCPGCGEKGRTDKPTVQNLMASGLSAATAQTLLRTKGERGVLQLQSFTCQKCKTTFNGLGQRPAPTPAPPPAPVSVPKAPSPAPSSSSGCFVVTATYGDERAYPVRVLRTYRDQVLAAHGWGRLLIRLYRRVGPLLARCIAGSPRLREVSRRLCERFARRVERSSAELLRARLGTGVAAGGPVAQPGAAGPVVFPAPAVVEGVALRATDGRLEELDRFAAERA